MWYFFKKNRGKIAFSFAFRLWEMCSSEAKKLKLNRRIYWCTNRSHNVCVSFVQAVSFSQSVGLHVYANCAAVLLACSVVDVNTALKQYTFAITQQWRSWSFRRPAAEAVRCAHFPPTVCPFLESHNANSPLRLNMPPWLCRSANPQCYGFYHEMHYSAKSGLAIACRLSIRPFVTLVDHDHIG